jgi:hypothetical protein
MSKLIDSNFYEKLVVISFKWHRSLALENTLKLIFTDKEEASAKRDEQRRRDKEEQMQSFTDIQRKTFEVQQRKLDIAEVKEWTMAKELELKEKECEAYCLPTRARS